MDYHNSSTSTQTNASTIILNENDVVFTGGKGIHFINHPGNVNYRNLVYEKLFNYKNLHTTQRLVRCHEVYNTIVSSGGRFLQLVNTTDFAPDNCSFVEIFWPDGVKPQIQMCFRNTGKNNPEHYNGLSSQQSQPPHADLSTILSALFKNIPPEQLHSFLANPATVNNITQCFNSLAEQLQLEQTFQFQGLVKQSSVNNSNTCSETQTIQTKTDATIKSLFRSFQEDTEDIPTTKNLLSSSDLSSKTDTKTKTYARNFYFDSGIIDSSSWQELLSRQIKGDRVKQTLSIYAFDAQQINKICSVESLNNNKKIKPHNNSTTRAYKCSSCPKDLRHGWSVQVRLIPNTDNLWAVVPYCRDAKHPLNQPHACHCHDKTKGNISDHVFLNSSLSRDFVSKNHWCSSGYIDNILGVLYSGQRKVEKKQLPTKSHRKEAIDFLLDRELDKLRCRYHQLPAFLRTLVWNNGWNPHGPQNNHMVSVVLQGTSGDKPNFFRMFLGFPVGCLGQKVHVPVLFIDFCHYQCPQYDGKLACLSSKLGDGSVVILAVSIIPNEDTNNIAWFIQLCALHGINFDCALFTDRGHIISATRQLVKHTNLKFNLMYCVQHLKRNVWHHFPALKESPMDNMVKLLLEKASRAETSVMFLECFIEFLSSVVRSNGSKLARDVAQYLFSINPIHWSIMANNESKFDSNEHLKRVNQVFLHLTTAVTLEEHLMPENKNKGKSFNVDELVSRIRNLTNVSAEDGSAPIAFSDLFENFRGCPRYGDNKNNVSEGLCNVFLTGDIRHRAPPDSIVKLIQLINEKTYKDHLPLIRGDKCIASVSPLMKIGHDHHLKQLDSDDVGNLNLGKENKGKPFVQCSISSLHCGVDEPVDNNSFDVTQKNKKNVDNTFVAGPVKKPVKKTGHANESSKGDKNSTSISDIHKISGVFVGKVPPVCLAHHPKHQQIPSGSSVHDSFDKPECSQMPLLDFQNEFTSDEELEKLFSGERDTKYATDSEGNHLSLEDVKKLRTDEQLSDEDKWLNDKVIDLCFWALQQRDKHRVWTATRRLRTHNLFFSAYFAVHLTNSTYVEYKNLSQYTQSHDIFEHERLFFPVNIGNNHWLCVVIFVRQQTIVAFDSMGVDREKLVLLFFRFLCNEHKFRKGKPLEGEWTLHSSVVSTPEQTNGYDCGVYTCMFADCLSLGCKLDFTPSHVTNYRKKLAWIILNDEISNIYELPRHSTRKRPSPEFRNPPPTFKDCVRFAVICRVKNSQCNSLIVKDIQTFSSTLKPITYWEVTSPDIVPHYSSDRKPINDLSKTTDICVGKNETPTPTPDASDNMTPTDASDDMTPIDASDKKACFLATSFHHASATEAIHDVSDGRCEDTTSIETEEVPHHIENEEVLRDGNLMPLSEMKIDSVQSKKLHFKGTFSSDRGNHDAHIVVSFDDQSVPVKNLIICDVHNLTISDKQCPCRCILEMDQAIRDQKFKWWPSDHAHLYPPSYQFKAVRNSVLSDPKIELIVKLPKFMEDHSPLDQNVTYKLCDAAQKYKHGLSGPRIRSSGEINSSARKPPKYKREGKRQVSLSDDSTNVNEPSRSLVYYSGNNFTKDAPQKPLPSTTTPHYNIEATGSIFYGSLNSDFVIKVCEDTVTIHDWCKKRNKTRERCKLVTLAGVARSNEGEEYVCLFHNVAHVDDNVDDSDRQFFVISAIQLSSSGVTKDESGFHVPTEGGKDVVFPSLELRKGINHCDDLEQLEILSNRWNPPPLPKIARCCSVCRKPDCKRQRCVELHSFGLGVADPKCLNPGEYFVFFTNNKMSSILNDNDRHIERPLELYADSDNYGLISETFPCQTSFADDNLKRKRKKKKQKRGHKTSASNSFRTKLTGMADGCTDVSIETQFEADEKGDTISIPPDFSDQKYAFHEEVMLWCNVPQSIRNGVLSILEELRKDHEQCDKNPSQNEYFEYFENTSLDDVYDKNLSQKEHFENTSLDDVYVPSTQNTQSTSCPEPDDSSNFEVRLTDQKNFERLINNRHPWKCIIGFQSVKEKREVHIEWWETEKSSNRRKTSSEPLWKWIQVKAQRQELVKYLANKHGEDEWEEMIGPVHWSKLNEIFALYRSNERSESIAAKLSSDSDGENSAKQSAVDVSRSRKRKPTRKRKNRFLTFAKKRRFKRSL